MTDSPTKFVFTSTTGKRGRRGKEGRNEGGGRGGRGLEDFEKLIEFFRLQPSEKLVRVMRARLGDHLGMC